MGLVKSDLIKAILSTETWDGAHLNAEREEYSNFSKRAFAKPIVRGAFRPVLPGNDDCRTNWWAFGEIPHRRDGQGD